MAPIHRGPQAVSQQTGASHTVHHAPNAALLIDFDNVTMGIRSDLQTELKNLLASDIIKGKVSVQRAYADWRRYPQYIVPLAESSIDMIMAPAYGSAKKNATDIRLAIDALELVFVRPEIGTFILLSGDSDFSSLVIKLKEYGKYVIGVGIRESSSDLLVMNCDEYYSYNSLAGLVKSGEEEVIKRDPWELVTEAVQRMKRNGDVMRADRLKQVMQQIDSSFDEKNVGKSKFSLFVSEAAKRGLLSLTKLENGQLEVDVPRGAAAAASGNGQTAVQLQAQPAAPATSDDAEEAERSRRGRRGGRGRTRDRDDRSPRGTQPQSAAGLDAAAQSETSPHSETMPQSAVDPQSAVRSSPAVRSSSAVRSPQSDAIGTAGLRLTRDEAFDLVKRAVASVASGDIAAAASKVRAAARSLLGRDSESLSERNFLRILHDAHDGDLIDLRRRGSDYEVVASASAPTVDRQLEAAAVANAPVAKPVPPAQRGMGARGTGRGGIGGKVPPAHLLSLGVVAPRGGSPAMQTALAASAAPAASSQVAATEAEAPAARSGRKRGAAKKARKAKVPASANDSDASDSEVKDAGAAPPAATRRPARSGRKRAAAKGGNAE